MPPSIYPRNEIFEISLPSFFSRYSRKELTSPMQCLFISRSTIGPINRVKLALSLFPPPPPSSSLKTTRELSPPRFDRRYRWTVKGREGGWRGATFGATFNRLTLWIIHDFASRTSTIRLFAYSSRGRFIKYHRRGLFELSRFRDFEISPFWDKNMYRKVRCWNT